jgi:hypothetical protein
VIVPHIKTDADIPEVRRIANAANPAHLTEEGRYRFEERLGILAGANTPTAGQVALAWCEAIRYDEKTRTNLRK